GWPRGKKHVGVRAGVAGEASPSSSIIADDDERTLAIERWHRVPQTGMSQTAGNTSRFPGEGPNWDENGAT
ncbi:MAG: hypothetical protein ACTHW1_08890, partial [Ancrocorticia sp.]|uniref:hypothetical protein n=1 Tax=Ancrocorticia sp. TaxID=2593684 RepID=UPI003F8ECDD9